MMYIDIEPFINGKRPDDVIYLKITWVQDACIPGLEGVDLIQKDDHEVALPLAHIDQITDTSSESGSIPWRIPPLWPIHSRAC